MQVILIIIMLMCIFIHAYFLQILFIEVTHRLHIGIFYSGRLSIKKEVYID